MSKDISNQKEIINILDIFFTKKISTNKIQKKINLIGKNIFKTTYQEINLLLKNEI